ncbi:MAG: hypothetical protein ACKOTZ_13905 [Chloroflexota bacterium]
MDERTTIGDALGAALAAYDTLQSVGETIEDEWTYVTDLAGAWRARIGVVAAARAAEPAGAAGPAIARAIDEIGRISDPHRAIDWLSTFPQVVLVAVGEAP